MVQPILKFLVAIAVVILIVAGTTWALRTEAAAPDQLVRRALGPAENVFAFAPSPAGLDGPAGACVVCHSIERHGTTGVAPGLWGIVDSEKARARWFGYSPALAKAGGRWTADHLGKYLRNPAGFLPGTTKTITVADDKRRAELIAFLKGLR